MKPWKSLRIIAGVLLVLLGCLSLIDGLLNDDSALEMAVHVAVVLVGAVNILYGFRQLKPAGAADDGAVPPSPQSETEAKAEQVAETKAVSEPGAAAGDRTVAEQPRAVVEPKAPAEPQAKSDS